MDKQQEALKLALEALCVAVEPKKGKVYAREFEPMDCFAMHEQAITAIKEALAQPAQEPVAWATKFDAVPLYAAPPQRPWVGLEAEDRLCAKYMQDAPDGIEAVIDYIEAALRSKNNG
jgi:hypothetical protein